MERVLEVFAALSDKTRLRLYRLLLTAGKEIAVCELIDAVKESQYNVSKHLKILKRTGMLIEQRKGRWILYSAVKSPEIDLSKALMQINEKEFEKDLKRLNKRLALRKGNEIISCQIANDIMNKK